jgi:hypothetical protein
VVTVKGNVMLCDACGRQVSMPMERGAGHKQSLNERVRTYAEEQGWKHAEQGDLCPDEFGAKQPT